MSNLFFVILSEGRGSKSKDLRKQKCHRQSDSSGAPSCDGSAQNDIVYGGYV